MSRLHGAIWSIRSCRDQRSKREMTWQHIERPIARIIVTVNGHLRRGVRGVS